MSTAVDITLHFDIGDQEPGDPQTVASLEDWLMGDLLSALHSVIGYPGDTAVVWAGDPRHPNYEISLPDCFHGRVGDANENGHYRCVDCLAFVTADGTMA